MKRVHFVLRISLALNFLLLINLPFHGRAWAKVDCGPVTNTSSDLPRTVAIASNLAGTGAHALASGLAAGSEQGDTDCGKGTALQRP